MSVVIKSTLVFHGVRTLMMASIMGLGLSGCGDETTTNTTNNVIDEAPWGNYNVSANCNGVISLDAKGMYDPEGKPLTYKWKVVESPVGSKLQTLFDNVTSQQVSVLADKTGTYVFRLVVSDSSKQTVVTTPDVSAIKAGDEPNGQSCNNPIVFADDVRKRLFNARPATALNIDGKLVGVSDTELVYQWKVVKSPTGSKPVTANANTAVVAFTPDQVGDYTLSVETTTKTGQVLAAAVVNVRASNLQATPLDYTVTQAAFITGTHKLASISGDDTFKIKNLDDGTVKSIQLPSLIKSFALSPDGTKALVVQKNKLSTINLTNQTVVNSWPITIGNTVSEAIMTNNSQAYILQTTPADSNSRLYPLNVDTGIVGVVESMDYYSYYSSLSGLQRMSSTAFFANTNYSNLMKFFLNKDGLIEKSKALTNNCSLSMLSDNLLKGCDTIFKLADDTNTLTSLGAIEISDNINRSPSFSYLALTKLVLNGDAAYGINTTYNYNFGQYSSMLSSLLFGQARSAEVFKINTTTWRDEAKVYLPMITSEEELQLPLPQQVFSDASNPLVVLATVPLKSGKPAYFILKP
ncbi:hypothetical protein FK216_07795 [Moraxellaceae bacterium AER2_44_116]|nr:hypothetical protein [Moraxellaceae bacterium]TQC98176.1 hypothetical protein FK216_07795 [Moraxellaceae bacterium AER2_44_116]